MKKLKKRLHILNKGRGDFQSFLRNLTPQAVLLSPALLLIKNIEKANGTAEIINIYIATGILITAFFIAAFINANDLWKSFSTPLEKWHKNVLTHFLNKKELTGCNRILTRLSAIFKKKLVEIIEILFINVFLQVALAIVIVQALSTVFGRSTN